MKFENGYQNSSENFIFPVKDLCNPIKEPHPLSANRGRGLSVEIVLCSVRLSAERARALIRRTVAILNSNCCRSRLWRARINKKELI